MSVPSVAVLSHRPSQIGLRLILFFCTLLVAWGSPLRAQDVSDDEIVRVSTDLSVFPIRVRTRDRHQPAKITAENFQLKDADGVTTSFYFSVGAERVAIVFALDESGSLGQVLSQQRDAALALFERFGQNSRVAVLRFSHEARIVVPFGNDSVAARSAFNFRERRNSPTAIFDAAASAVRMFDTLARDPAERRIVILISDGLDTASSTKASAIIRDAQERNTSFYTIQIPLFAPRDGHLAVREASKGFKDLAEKTGGKYFLTADAKSALSPLTSADLSGVFRAIEEDLKSQYVVGFYVGDKARDDRAHRVSIVLTDPATEYSVAQYGFSRIHHFSIRLRRDPAKN